MYLPKYLKELDQYKIAFDLTANGEIITLSEDGHFSVKSKDGSITDGRCLPQKAPEVIY